MLKARMGLASEFGSAFPELDVGKNRSSFQSNLWEAILQDAGDPETEIVDWMRHGCPTGGKNSHIKSCGVFPLATAASSAVESSRILAKIMENSEWDHSQHTSYKSF